MSGKTRKGAAKLLLASLFAGHRARTPIPDNQLFSMNAVAQNSPGGLNKSKI
jgi:hypothetical protein